MSNSLSILHKSYFLFSFRPQFYFLKLVFHLHLILFARAPKFLSYVAMLPVNRFMNGFLGLVLIMLLVVENVDLNPGPPIEQDKFHQILLSNDKRTRFTANQGSFSGLDMYLGRPRKKLEDNINTDPREMNVTEIRLEARSTLCHI